MSARTSRFTPLFVVLAALAVLSCDNGTPAALELGSGPESPAVPGPSAAISDAANGGADDSFFFLPPLVPQPMFAGLFDASQAPVVEICKLAAGVCGSILATYTTTSGPGSETIRVNPEEENYIVNWHTDEFDLDDAKTYRIRVLAGGEELGFADVLIVVSQGGATSAGTDESIVLKDGRTLPVKFRIEQVTKVTVGVSGGEISTPDGGVTLDVPPGALTGEVEISVKPLEPEDDQLSIVDLGPDGLTFLEPVPVTLGYDPAALPPGVAEEDLALNLLVDGRWRVLPDGSRDDAVKSVTAPFFHFSAGGAGPAELAIFCPGDGDPTTFETLPEALDAVADGGTVEVCDGIHAVEDVAVSRPVTIRPEPGASPTLMTSVAARTLVVGGYTSGTVLIEGLTIAMTSPEAPGFFPYAIRAQDPYDQLVIRYVTFDTDPASWGALRGLMTSVPGGGVTLDGVTAMGGARAANVTDSRLDITNSSFSDFSLRAVQIARSTSPGRIDNSTFGTCGSTHCIGVFNSSVDIVSNTFDGSINIGINSTVLIDDNDISGCGPNFCIFGGGTGTQLTVTNNRIDGSGTDPVIYLGTSASPAAGGLIANNTITNCFGTCIRVDPEVGPTTVENNTCSPVGC